MNEQEIYLLSQITCAQIEMNSMVAENQQRQHLGQSMAYTEGAFMELIDKYGLSHNAVLSYLRGC